MTRLPILSSQEEALTPDDLVDINRPGKVNVSASGAQVVYQVSPVSKKGDNNVSSIWLAEMGKENSARQLTSGLTNDQGPQFAPDEDCIAFLSDRAKPGGKLSTIYCLPLAGGEAFPLTESEKKKSIASFKWSSSGRFIAFLSPDEKTKEEEAKEKEKDDAVVYGEKWEFNRLRLLHVATKQVTVLRQKEGHIIDFAWSDDETKIACVSQQTTALDSGAADGMQFELVDTKKNEARLITTFPGHAEDLVWLNQSQLYFLSNVTPSPGTVSSRCIYEMNLGDGKWNRHSCGDTDCAAGLRSCGKSPLVQVQSGLRDQLRFLTSPDGTIWDQERNIHSWHSAQRKAILALSLSSQDRPPEIYSAESSDGLVRLSNHSSKLASKLPLYNIEPFYCSARDGTKIDGLFLTPMKSKNSKPWPTLVDIHGGPYWRITASFDNSHYGFIPYVLSGGEVAVICPNYRGSSSHGEEFASKIKGRMGTEDYTDVIDMVKDAINIGLVDKDRVMMGGWSQGGFLSYLTAARNNEAEQGFKLRGAICGAGVTDWDMMCMSSDVPVFESELAGPSPWESDIQSHNNRHGSAIWYMKQAAATGKEQTPILILHGEEDERVPHTQAVAYHRACLRYGIPCEFVTYPREGHFVAERAHQIDMLKRYRRFVETHLL